MLVYIFNFFCLLNEGKNIERCDLFMLFGYSYEFDLDLEVVEVCINEY